MAPADAVTNSGPTLEPVTVSVATPRVGDEVPRPLTVPAPPTSANVIPEAKEVTILPHASWTVAASTQVFIHFTPEEQPETTMALAGPNVDGVKVVLTAEVRPGVVATNW